MLNLWLWLNNYGYLWMIMLLSIAFICVCVELGRIRRAVVSARTVADFAYEDIHRHIHIDHGEDTNNG